MTLFGAIKPVVLGVLLYSKDNGGIANDQIVSD